MTFLWFDSPLLAFESQFLLYLTDFFFLSSCSTFLEGKMMRILCVLLMALYLLSCASAYVIYRMGPIYRRPIYRAYYRGDIDDDNIIFLG